MRIEYVLMTALLGGCAGTPPPEPPIATRVVMAVPGAVPTPNAAAADPNAHLVKVDTTNLVAVQKAGYKLVTKEGQQLYCRTDLITGSHVQTRTTCLTELELDEQMNATKQSMEHIGAHQVGPSGH